MRLLKGTAALFALTLFASDLAEARSRCRDTGRYAGYRDVDSNRYGYRNANYRDSGYYDRDAPYRRGGEYRGRYEEKRSVGESVAIVGGSAAAGAGIGALAGGGKGAALGAAIGGTAGFIYDQQTRTKRRRY